MWRFVSNTGRQASHGGPTPHKYDGPHPETVAKGLDAGASKKGIRFDTSFGAVQNSCEDAAAKAAETGCEMGGQGIERREILRFIGIASIAGTFPGFEKWSFACAQNHVHEAAATVPRAVGAYKSLFFSPQQFQMVEHLAEMIIPRDETPGAKDAGVAEFIDFMVANRVPVSAKRDIRCTQDAIELGTEAQIQFVAGLDWMNARSFSEFGKKFMDCSGEQQKRLLEELAYKAKFKPTTESGRQFFQLMRDYTVVGYYTTRIGLESLGYPGLRVVWPSLPGCPHPDDPEHIHLHEPGAPKSASANGAA